ncbi:DUF1127 domain-containing protein [Pseudodonghicola sp.]|jgi:uncharacterized protein YjiS (DUF1127 family)|uniref:DUF1127 domain-containing protein n=1 Tax=Pseudodonghicola sp. TaxID=1969463 RepID=UPI003A97885E
MATVVFLHPQDRTRPSQPARSSGFGSLPALWWHRLTLRRMLRDELLRHPDSVLSDAGWSRAAALEEAAKPFWRG